MKINNFILKTNTICIMKNLLDKTKKDRLEKGFDLCLNNNKELIARNICSGSSCKVDMKA